MARKYTPKHALNSVKYRQLLPYRKNASYMTIVPDEAMIGYRRAADGPGTWVVRYVRPDGTTTEKTVGTADDYEVANGKTVFTFDQVRARLSDIIVDMGGRPLDPKRFNPLPNAEIAVQRLKAKTRRETAPATATARAAPSGNGGTPPAAAPVDTSPRPRVRLAAPLDLATHKLARAGFSKAIRGLRSAHEALAADDPDDLAIAATHLASAAKLFRTALAEAGILPAGESRQADDEHGTAGTQTKGGGA